MSSTSSSQSSSQLSQMVPPARVRDDELTPRSRKARERFSRKRKVTFAENEASVPPSLRLHQRNDLNVIVRRPISAHTMKLMKQQATWFKEFYVDECEGKEEVAETFFDFNGPDMPISLIRSYLLWVSKSRGGSIRSKISLQSMVVYALRFFSCVNWHRGQTLDQEVSNQIMWWVRETLGRSDGLPSVVKTKPIAHMEDVVELLKTLYSPISMISYVNVRALCHFNLLINILVDSCGRIGEVLPTTRTQEEQCLHWEDVEFWVKPSSDPTSDLKVELYGRLTFRWLKGHRNDPETHKVIPLSLLPPHRAFEDTLRQLIYTAIVERHFQDITAWSDIESLHPAKYGQMIPIKRSSLKLPVLRGIDQRGRMGDKSVSEPVAGNWFGKLGIHAGLKYPLTR